MDKITTKSTSLHTATVDDVVLRETKTTRMVFRPLLVDNEKNKAAAVKGQLLFQKKSVKDAWEDTEAINLAKLKVGEGVRLDVKSGELLTFFNELTDLYALYAQHGTQLGKSTFTKADPQLQQLSNLPGDELHAVLAANSSLGGDLLTKLLMWATTEEDLPKLIHRLLGLSPNSLQILNTSANVVRLRTAVKEWAENKESSDEELWQDLLAKHIHVLEQVYSWPVNIVGQKMYVGGKGVDNKGGGLVDFLLKNSLTNNVTLIEIKTPRTSLLKSTEYRTGIYNTSNDLTGSVMQVVNYRDSLLRNYQSLESTDLFDAFDPKCVVIIGHAGEELTDKNRRKTFELYRNQLSDVTVVTYDELVRKTQNLIKILEDTD
jgi:hypothetical protein